MAEVTSTDPTGAQQLMLISNRSDFSKYPSTLHVSLEIKKNLKKRLVCAASFTS